MTLSARALGGCFRGLLTAAALGPGCLLLAQVRVAVIHVPVQEQPYRLESGCDIPLVVEPLPSGASQRSFLEDLGYEPQWLWTLLEQPAGGAVVAQRDASAARFHAPTVSEVTTCHIQAVARNHSQMKAVVAIQVYPRLTLSVAGAEAVSGRACELLAARGAALPAEFRLAGPNGGTLNRDAQGRTFWTPPQVEVPTPVVLGVQDPLTRLYRDGSGFADEERTLQVLPAVMIHAKRYATDCHHLVAGNACALKAERRDGAAALWQWTVLGAGGGQFGVDPQGATTYTAPQASMAFRVYLRATDLNHPGDSALWAMDVMPRIPNLPDYYAEVVLPAAQGKGWMAPTPELTLFAVKGEPGAAANPRAPGYGCLTWVEDGPAMGALSGTWLAQSGRFFDVFSKRGVHLQTLRMGQRADRITAVAVRPGGSLAGNPRQIVFAEYDDLSRQGTIWGASPDGTSTLLAGRAVAEGIDGTRGDTDLDEDYLFPCNGQGAQAAIGFVTGMAMSPDGTVTFTEAIEDDDALEAPEGEDHLGVIRQLGPDGQVTVLAGALDSELNLGQPPMDGHGEAAVVASPSQVVLDPVAGAFYFADLTGLRKVTPFGAVTTLATPAGANDLRDLQIFGDHLLALGGRNTLWMLNLRTGAWRTLTGGSPLFRQEECVRMGPLSAVSPRLPAMACAALAKPGALAVNTQGTCIIADGPMLLKLDLSRWAGHAAAGPAAGASAMEVDSDEERDDPPSAALGESTSAPPAKKQKVKH